MTVKDLLAQVFKTTAAPSNAFLTVRIPLKSGPPTKLVDKDMVLATLFEENHTLNFEVKHEAGKMPRSAAQTPTRKPTQTNKPTPTTTPTPTKKPTPTTKPSSTGRSGSQRA